MLGNNTNYVVGDGYMGGISFAVIIAEIGLQAPVQRVCIAVSFRIDVFTLERPPKTFDTGAVEGWWQLSRIVCRQCSVKINYMERILISIRKAGQFPFPITEHETVNERRKAL